MHPDTPPTDRPARLRLVDIRVGPGRQLQLGGTLAGVLAERHDRSDAANWIISTVAGPRPPESDGSIDVGGKFVSVHSLPAPMLAPGAPRVIDSELLRIQWRAACARRRDELAAAHASYRLERYRIEAALERARSRRVPLPREVEAAAAAFRAPEPLPVPVAEPEPVAPKPELVQEPAASEPASAPTEGEDAADNATVRARLESLLAALDALPSAPLPEGGLLADAWDAHSLLVRVRDAVDDLPSTGVERIEARVDAARAAVAKTSSGVPEVIREHIEQCHLGVLQAEALVLSAKRRERSNAVTGYEHAVAAELIALADAGIESYAAFVAIVEESTGPANASARRAALSDLAAARAAFDSVLQVPDMPTRAELEEREELMRARATQLLGREPGADPAGELRALRVPTEAHDDLLDEIAAALRSGGIEPAGNVVDFARAFLVPAGAPPASRPEAAPSAPPPPRPQPAPRAAPQSPAAARAVDVAALEQQRFAHDRALEQLDTDLAAIDGVYNAPLSALGAADLTYAVEVILDLYRRGQLLGGQLPLVLDGALDGLSAAGREAAVNALVEADDLQTIVVSDDVEVMQSLARTGVVIVRWPERDSNEPDPSRLQPTPAPGA